MGVLPYAPTVLRRTLPRPLVSRPCLEALEGPAHALGLKYGLRSALAPLILHPLPVGRGEKAGVHTLGSSRVGFGHFVMVIWHGAPGRYA